MLQKTTLLYKFFTAFLCILLKIPCILPCLEYMHPIRILSIFGQNTGGYALLYNILAFPDIPHAFPYNQLRRQFHAVHHDFLPINSLQKEFHSFSSLVCRGLAHCSKSRPGQPCINIVIKTYHRNILRHPEIF